MRCPDCKGSISLRNFIIEKHCPACGERLYRKPTKEQIKEFFISFAEDRGYIFWALCYILAVWVIGLFEQIFGTGVLYDYISDHEWRFIFLAIMAGSIADYAVKANVEVSAVRNKFIFKPPIYLRRFRFWSNAAVFVATGLTWYILHRWPGYITVLPIFTFLSAFLLCLVWAFMGLFATEDDMNDKRIRYFFQEMRVERIKRFNRAGAIYIGGMFLAGITFYRLIKVSGLWWYIYNSRIVYNFVTFFTQYFSWTKKFID